KDSERFSRMIIRLHRRGVVWREIAEASGHTISGLRMRAARHGYGKGAPPSIAPYRRSVIPRPKKVDLTEKKSTTRPTRRKCAWSAPEQTAVRGRSGLVDDPPRVQIPPPDADPVRTR